MATGKPMQIKFLGAKDQMDALHRFAQSHSSGIKVQSYGPEKDPTNLKFGLADVASMVGFIESVLAIPTLAVSLYELLKPKDSQRIVVQTPTMRIELVSKKDLTPKEVEDALRYALKVAK